MTNIAFPNSMQALALQNVFLSFARLRKSRPPFNAAGASAHPHANGPPPEHGTKSLKQSGYSTGGLRGSRARVGLVVADVAALVFCEGGTAFGSALQRKVIASWWWS